jgi:hypothetical protein
MGLIRAFKPRKDLRERFDSKWIPEPNTGCHLWLASDDGDGKYGRFSYPISGVAKHISAHRAAWLMAGNEAPVAPLEIDHRCRQTFCVNPAHLRVVTKAENLAQADKWGLSIGGLANGERQKAKTHCPQGHSYDDAIITRQGWRLCRQCVYAKNRRQAARKRAASLICTPAQ